MNTDKCCMKLGRTGVVFEHIGLALMVGGMLAMGAFAAPTLFHNLPPQEAGRLMMTLFRKYDIVIQWSLVAIILGEFLRFTAARKLAKLNEGGIHQPSTMAKIRVALVTIMIGTCAMSIFSIHPKMEAYQQAKVVRGVGAEGQEFDKLHKRATQYYKIELYMALAILILSSLSTGPKRVHGHCATKTEETAPVA